MRDAAPSLSFHDLAGRRSVFREPLSLAGQQEQESEVIQDCSSGDKNNIKPNAWQSFISLKWMNPEILIRVPMLQK